MHTHLDAAVVKDVIALGAGRPADNVALLEALEADGALVVALVVVVLFQERFRRVVGRRKLYTLFCSNFRRFFRRRRRTVPFLQPFACVAMYPHSLKKKSESSNKVVV